jgi:dipeptidase E
LGGAKLGKIVALSGGELKDARSKMIDDQIIRLSGQENPNVLFIPTASNDSESYFEAFKEHFGNQFKCNFDVLYLLKKTPQLEEIEKAILSSDIVYVGGGNTLKMMKLWRKIGVDKVLFKAHLKGIVLSGISAGAICWFNYGSSDSRMFTNPNAGLIRVSGLGLINALYCPHYDSEKGRKPHLETLIKKTGGTALALDEYCALIIIDDSYKLITYKENSNGYKVYWKNNVFHEEIIEKDSQFMPLSKIVKKK